MKKIMFNDQFGLTKAVLDGRKTMTRRGIRLKDGCSIEKITIDSSDVYYFKNSNINEHGIINGVPVSNFDGFVLEKAPYKVGEIVAVAQRYNEVPTARFDLLEKEYGKDISDGNGIHLPAWNNKQYVKAKFMQHRIEINNIRVERLQDISDEDCLREGVSKAFNGTYNYIVNKDKKTIMLYDSPREAFSVLIDKVSGKGTWESNPYVFVYEFELVY